MRYDDARRADDTTPLIDWTERLRLDGDDIVAACVEGDGSTSLWLITATGSDQSGAHGCACTAEHEQLGSLPASVQQRIDRAFRPRCGQPTASGHPCRIHVGHQGGACRWHRLQRAEQVCR